MASDIKCPICGYEQIHAERKGFSTGKASAGTILSGDLLIGALAGSHSKNKAERNLQYIAADGTERIAYDIVASKVEV